MSQFIYRDYQLIGNKLFKGNMDSGHLMYKNPYRGSPAIDAENVWDKYKDQVDEVEFIMHYRKGGKAIFRIDKDTFDHKKQEIVFKDFGVQYAVPKQYWKLEYLKS